MSLIKYATKEITCKIVYYGPGRSGKTTNLKYIHSRVPASKKTELMSLATERDRTLFFDFLPLELGKFGGFTTKFQLYTVPGQVYYDSTRRLVLQGADGVVFVVDSQRERLQDNVESFENLKENLEKNGLSIYTSPLVIQYNKRDLDDIVPVQELEEIINVLGVPSFEAIAIMGKGVIETFKAIGSMVLQVIRKKLEGSGG